MADLTAAQITYIRTTIGDTATTPDLSDEFLEYLFDNDADSNVNYTIVYAIRALIGFASRKVAHTNSLTGETKQYQQWFEHLKDQLKIWENITGLAGSTVGTVTTGTINLGIDEEDEQFNIT